MPSSSGYVIFHEGSGYDSTAGRHLDGGVVDRFAPAERRGAGQSGCRHGVGIGDGAWRWAWAGGVHGGGTDRADGMRGDGVGVGDVDQVPGGPRCARHAADDDDGGRAEREHVRGNLFRFGERECISSIELGGDGVGVGDGARSRAGAGGVHGAGTTRGKGWAPI